MGFFRKDPLEKYIQNSTKKIEKILYEDGCKYFGLAVMIMRPTDPSAMLVDNLRSMTARYYLEEKGTIYLRAESSFDEFESLVVSSWGYGFNGNHTNKLFFACDTIPWIFIIEEETEGKSEEWFLKHYKKNKTTMKSIFPL